ncbi:MAG: hypothetical protein COT91_04295 [Candidatus Doudnabacteria bacterium CG10_big_fil_rev_8_21_14_0_10_41_10]|uniref:Transposase IS200-like domain-containing protein n=1 Tax=Candidatus Doudnabacteria bacterium CG10_big_fil_rev_8_21_14_0_10_41_10 TaxID=1974551 RepID=A0A2H0VCQ2_9BACT|nr:MAG: hypothetical protein COT91_04295 [Candidatus Doudnabacteria bacterium CG10_big_fil_rev_8_21_14_0_10_41_10]
MARQSRIDIAREVYHVINRANTRWRIFKTAKDYAAVIDSLEEIKEEFPLDIFAFCIMPNHWHFAVKPKEDGDMGRFFGKFTQKVTQRWHVSHHTTGSGHLFQGRFKSFLVEQESYFLQLMKYIESNPLRAKLANKAEDWQWGSLFLRKNNTERSSKILTPWPVDIPSNYLKLVNQPFPKPQLESIRHSVTRNKPLGGVSWVEKMISKYDLQYTVRPEGRPKK